MGECDLLEKSYFWFNPLVWSMTRIYLAAWLIQNILIASPLDLSVNHQSICGITSILPALWTLAVMNLIGNTVSSM